MELQAGKPVSAERRRSYFHFGLILFAGALARIPFYLAFWPIWSGDSPGYAAPYYLWQEHIFYLGERTPVYPLFLGLAQWLAGVPTASVLEMKAAYAAVLLQSVLDIAAAALFYSTLRALSMRKNTALIAALFLATIPGICVLEVNILNMSLSCSLLVLVAWLFVITLNHIEAGTGFASAAIATGVSLSVSVLNRPEFLIFLTLMVAVTAGMYLKTKPADSAGRKIFPRAALIMGTVAIAPILGWMTLMYAGIGEFRITTLSGWNKSRTVYNLFSRVDPEDRRIGEIMSRTYQRQFQSGADVNLRETMWQAERELLSNYPQYPIVDPTSHPSRFHHGVTRAAHTVFGFDTIPCNVNLYFCSETMRKKINTGDYLGTVSGRLARRYPAEWGRNIVANFLQESFDFHYMESKPAVEGFKSRSVDRREIVRSERLREFASMADRTYAPLLLLTYLVTLCYFVLSPVTCLRRYDEHWFRDAAVTTLAVASVGTIIGTCVLAGYNHVYSLPHLVVFTICTAYAWENRSRIVTAVRSECLEHAQERKPAIN